MQAYVERNFADRALLEQQAVAIDRMLLHDGKFLVGELARLVENLDRRQRLAEVVQQPGHGRLPRCRRVERQLMRKRRHQRADRHGMHVGVVVGRLEAGQADQRPRIARHRGRNFLGHGGGGLDVDGPPHAHFLKHRDDGLLGLGANTGCAPQFLRSRRLLVRRPRFGGGLFDALQRLADILLGAFDRLGNDLGDRVDALGDIDPHLADAALQHAAQVVVIREQEILAPERMLHPGAAKLLDVHAQAKVLDANLLQHATTPQRRTDSGLMLNFAAFLRGFPHRLSRSSLPHPWTRFSCCMP